MIDWDLYVLADELQEALIGNWGHYWHPSPEQAEFEKAQGRPFEERQHILRLRGTKGFNVVIFPCRKEERPENVRVEQTDDGTQVSYGSTELTIGEQYYAYLSEKRTMVATFGTDKTEAHGVTIDGGPAEVTIQGNQAIVTIDGPAGTRRITLPASFQLDQSGRLAKPPALQGQPWIVDHDGGKSAPLTFRSSRRR